MTRTYQAAWLAPGVRNPKHRPRPTGSRGKKRTAFQYGQFCAWDGEGITSADGTHQYVLLASYATNEAPGLASDERARWDAQGLSTADILAHVCARARALDARTCHVIFGGSYDVNMWLRDVNPQQLARIWRGRWVIVGRSMRHPYGYRVQYRPRRSLTVHELHRDGTGTRVTLWDVWGFFQGTFVGALEKYGLPVPDHLRAMKRARHHFRGAMRERIITYCLDECRLLCELMAHVREHLTTAQLNIKRWDGAGACAAALLHREGVREHQPRERPPEPVRRAIQHAYAGGRIELVQYGHAPRTPLHHYDINSAYPSALRDVPSLAAGTWVHEREPGPVDGFTLFHVKWNFHDSASRCYPFFWRASNGNIFYPPLGESWVWTPELRAALDALDSGALAGTVDILEAWRWVPAASHVGVRPFAFIDALFSQRAEWKRDGVGAEKMLKLALNSLYGKCAQHVGAVNGEAPRYHCLEWAGWTTASTRAALFAAACHAGDGTVMLATDGIFSTRDIPQLPISKQLGAWDYHCHAGATVVQSGVYWLDDRREDGTRVSVGFSRGFDKGSLSRPRIVSAWKERARTWDASLTRFVTMGAVVSGHAQRHHWRTWRTVPRVLALTPQGTKRTSLYGPREWVHVRGAAHSGAHPAYGYIPTAPVLPAALFAGDRLSTMYPLPWYADVPFSLDAITGRARFEDWEAMETD